MKFRTLGATAIAALLVAIAAPAPMAFAQYGQAAAPAPAPSLTRNSTAARNTPAPPRMNGNGRETARDRMGAYFSLNQRIGFTSVSLTLPVMTVAIIAGTKVTRVAEQFGPAGAGG